MFRFRIANLIFRVSRAVCAAWCDDELIADAGIGALLFLIAFLCTLRFLAA